MAQGAKPFVSEWQADAPVSWLRSRRHLLIVASCLVVPGIILAVASTFMPWLQNVFGSHQTFNGWDLVATNVWVPGQKNVGVHWLVTQSWADEPSKTAFTALSVVTVCLVALIGLVVIAAMRNRGSSRWLTIVSWTPLLAGCALCVFALGNLDAWNGTNWRSKAGVSWLLVAGLLVVIGGVFTGLAERSKSPRPERLASS
jgi:hypothetical protein